MRLIHHTDIYSLENILLTGVFRAVSGHPLNGDAGLNCFDAHRSGNMGQNFERTGALLICEWEGPISSAGMNVAPPYQIGILHDMLPWRCFVPVGTSGTMLRVIGFKCSEKSIIERLEFKKRWWIPEFVSDGIFRRKKKKFLLNLRSFIRSQERYLKVVGP